MKWLQGSVVLIVVLLLGSSTVVGDGLKDQRHLFEGGLYLGALMPSSDHELYRPGESQHQEFAKAAFDLGLRLSYLPLPYVGPEFETGLMPTTVANDEQAILYTVRGHVLGQIPIAERWAPFALLGVGMLAVSSDSTAVGSDKDFAFHYGLGLKYYVTNWMALRFDFRHNISEKAFDAPDNDSYAHHFEVLAGLSFVLGWKEADRDGDGVADSRDRCPDVHARTVDGCPPDRDGDGVIDSRDKCPDVPAKTADGCPDSDGDGIPDSRDKCPRAPAKTADGCPDSDGDGVPDARDRCPTIAARTADGCPADRDGDGILDPGDSCPDQPETKNGYLDEDGCPDELPKLIKKFTGTIRGITFATNKAVIRPASYRTLKRAVDVLKQFPSVRLMIRGHTDNQGSREHNMDLSQRRAQSVRDYLVGQGIAADRLRTEGVGPDEPVGDNSTRSGRARNRRIEFKILSGK